LDVFVGSSNLTGAGLEHNLEINVHFKMTKPSDSLEIIKWKSYWSKIRGLPGVHPYSDKLVSELEKRGVFKQVRNMINLNDLFPANDTSLYPIVTGTIYVQTLQPNDFPATGESDAIVPRAARRVNEAFWGWDKLFNTSPGGHKQRLFPNTTLRYNGGEVKTNCRLYEVDSVSNFRLTCPAVRSLLPIDHHDYLFTVQIQGKNCDIRFISPNDPDYWDYYASTRPLGNSDKRWGYI
jgi:hypothetical protein